MNMKFPLLIDMKKPIYLLAENFSCSAMFSKKDFAIVSNLRFISRTISRSYELSMKKVL